MRQGKVDMSRHEAKKTFKDGTRYRPTRSAYKYQEAQKIQHLTGKHQYQLHRKRWNRVHFDTNDV